MTQPNTIGVERTLNQFVVQWDVAGALNGDTADVAPGLATSGGILVPDQQDEDGVFRIPVSGDLGIIDPDALGAQGGSGDRYIQWIRVEAGSGNIPPGFAIRIVDASNLVPSLGDPIVFEDITAGTVFGVSPSFYRSQFYFVPQGCAIQILGLLGFGAGNENRVKIGFRSATSAKEDAHLQQNMCCQSGAAGGGGGGGAPEDVDFSLSYYSFSSQSYSTAGADNGTYFGFGAYYFSPTPLTFMQQSNAIFNAEEGTVSPAAIKLAIRDGEVTNIALRCTSAFTGQPFIEVSTGVGAFVRTFLTAAPQVFAANTTTIVACTGGTFAAGDRVRVGVNITTEVLVSDIFAEVEITTPQ